MTDALSPAETPGALSVLATHPQDRARAQSAKAFGGHRLFQGTGGVSELEENILGQASTQKFILKINKPLSLVITFSIFFCSQIPTPHLNSLLNYKSSRTKKKITRTALFLSSRC